MRSYPAYVDTSPSKSQAKTLYIEKVMIRVMNGVTYDPVRVDVRPIERHNRVPLVGSQFRKRVEKRCRFSFNTEQRYVDVDLPRRRLEW